MPARRRRSRDAKRRTPSIAEVAVPLYLAWNALAFLVAGIGARGFLGEPFLRQGLLAVALYGASWWLGSSFFDAHGDRVLLARTLAGTLIVVGGYALLQVRGLDPFWAPPIDLRAFSSIGQANALGAYLMMCLPVAMVLVAVGPSPYDLPLGAAASLVAALAAVAAGSRAAFLAGAVAVIAYLWASGGPRRLGRRALLPALAALVLVGSLVALAPGLRTIAAGTASKAIAPFSAAGERSVRDHADLWRVAIRMVVDHPLVGLGPERFPDAFPGYRDAVLGSEGRASFGGFRVESPHSVYLSIAVAAGLPALAVYLAVVGLGLAGFRVRLGSTVGGERALLAAYAAALVAGLVADGAMSASLPVSWLMWVLLGFGCAGLSERPPRRTEAPPPSAG